MSYKEVIWFAKKVNAKHYPKYYEIIKNEINFSKMTQCCDTGKYASREEFMKDLQLMKSNAILFNTANHDCSRAAEKLIEIVQTYYQRDKNELIQLEREIRMNTADVRSSSTSGRSGGRKTNTTKRTTKAKRGSRKLIPSTATVVEPPTPSSLISPVPIPMSVNSTGTLMSPPTLTTLQSSPADFVATMNPFLDESIVHSPGAIPLQGTPGALPIGSPFVGDGNGGGTNATPGNDAFFGTTIGLTPGPVVTPGTTAAIDITPGTGTQEEDAFDAMDFDDFVEEEGMEEEIIEEESGVVEGS